MMNLKTSLPLLASCLFLCLLFTNSAPYTLSDEPIVTEEFQLDEFSGIGLSIPATVTITQGARQKVMVSAHKSTLDNIRKEIKNDVWEIGFRKKAKAYEKISIEITVSELQKVSIAGSGNVSTTNTFPQVDKFNLSISGSGNADLQVAAKVIHCNISGSGNAKLNGEAQELEIGLAGSGNVNAYDLEVQHCKVSTAGSGNVKTTTNGEIEASIVGSGHVYYKGDPRVDVSVIGSGKVRKAD